MVFFNLSTLNTYTREFFIREEGDLLLTAKISLGLPVQVGQGSGKLFDICTFTISKFQFSRIYKKEMPFFNSSFFIYIIYATASLEAFWKFLHWSKLFLMCPHVKLPFVNYSNSYSQLLELQFMVTFKG